MKYLGIDYGQKRTGIAVSDPSGIMAFPRRTILMRGREAFFAELLALAGEEGAEAFVVGLPLRLDGSDSETTRQVRNMAGSLRRRTCLPVHLVEETLSSWDAQRLLRAAGKMGKDLSALKDQAAAVAILETFLQGIRPDPRESALEILFSPRNFNPTRATGTRKPLNDKDARFVRYVPVERFLQI
jgi:putative Holliday junction resolvase